MRVDLHNHTTLCNHATSSVEEYILKAIDLGIDVYGFSEHAPMNYDPKYRMALNEIDLYESWINEVKEKYKEKIKVLLAYEVDYINGYVLDEVIKRDVDYFIGSVHFLNNKTDMWGFDNPEFIGVYQSKDIDQIWQEYFNAIEEMAKTGQFDVVGHLDLIKVFKFLPKKDVKIIASDALKAIKKSNMTIEINSAGFRKPIGQAYPSNELLQLAFELEIPITFSSDAHSIEQIGYKYDEAKALARKIGYTKAVYYEKREKILFDF